VSLKAPPRELVAQRLGRRGLRPSTLASSTHQPQLHDSGSGGALQISDGGSGHERVRTGAGVSPERHAGKRGHDGLLQGGGNDVLIGLREIGADLNIDGNCVADGHVIAAERRPNRVQFCGSTPGSQLERADLEAKTWLLIPGLVDAPADAVRVRPRTCFENSG
jgi:hypothetical protein